MNSANRRIGESANRRNSKAFKSHRADSPIHRLTGSSREAGQGMSELVIMLPLLVMLAFGALAITYMCWQGIKVQEAANLAARVQGQERVAGGTSANDINQVNGTGPGMGGDADPSAHINPNDPTQIQTLRTLAPPMGGPSPSTVYGKYRQIVRDLFTTGEQEHLYVPPPVRGSITDQVKVVRLMQPPALFSWQMDPVMVTSTAYGGEDTNMYSLPRWGKTSSNGNNNLYWQQILQKGNDNSANFSK